MKKSICFPLAVLPALLLNACIFFSVNNDFDVDNGYFRNNSSHNIYIQECYLPDNDNSGNKIYNEHGEAIEKNTVANGAPAPNSYSTYLEKILIVDTDTRKLLKRISAEEYFKLLGLLKLW